MWQLVRYRLKYDETRVTLGLIDQSNGTEAFSTPSVTIDHGPHSLTSHPHFFFFSIPSNIAGPNLHLITIVPQLSFTAYFFHHW
jgi:hypothetical protein